MKRLPGEAELFTERTVQLQPEVLNRVNTILGKQTVTITLFFITVLQKPLIL